MHAATATLSYSDTHRMILRRFGPARRDDNREQSPFCAAS